MKVISLGSNNGIHHLSSISPALGNSHKTLTLYWSESLPYSATILLTKAQSTIGDSSELKLKVRNHSEFSVNDL